MNPSPNLVHAMDLEDRRRLRAAIEDCEKEDALYLAFHREVCAMSPDQLAALLNEVAEIGQNHADRSHAEWHLWAARQHMQTKLHEADTAPPKDVLA